MDNDDQEVKVLISSKRDKKIKMLIQNWASPLFHCQVEKVEEFEPGQESYAGVIKNLKECSLTWRAKRIEDECGTDSFCTLF